MQRSGHYRQNTLGFDVAYDLESFFADQEEIVDKSSNRIKYTVNPLLTPPSLWLIYFKQVSGRGGRVIETGHVLEREGLFIYGLYAIFFNPYGPYGS